MSFAGWGVLEMAGVHSAPACEQLASAGLCAWKGYNRALCMPGKQLPLSYRPNSLQYFLNYKFLNYKVRGE